MIHDLTEFAAEAPTRQRDTVLQVRWSRRHGLHHAGWADV